jgi:hypothetical protein
MARVRHQQGTQTRRSCTPYVSQTEKMWKNQGARMCRRAPPKSIHPTRDTTSPTVSTQAVFLTYLIDAYEGRDVATVDIYAGRYG